MKNIVFYFSLVVVFFKPLAPILLAIPLVVIWRRGSSFWRIKKSKSRQKTKCRLYEVVAWKAAKWNLIYLLWICSCYYMDINIFTAFGSKSFVVTKGLAVLIIAYELFMYNENYKAVTGQGVVGRLKGVNSSFRTFSRWNWQRVVRFKIQRRFRYI